MRTSSSCLRPEVGLDWKHYQGSAQHFPEHQAQAFCPTHKIGVTTISIPQPKTMTLLRGKHDTINHVLFFTTGNKFEYLLFCQTISMDTSHLMEKQLCPIRLFWLCSPVSPNPCTTVHRRVSSLCHAGKWNLASGQERKGLFSGCPTSVVVHLAPSLTSFR